MSRTYRPYIDWMKAIGITLIVMGHVAGRPTNFLVPPIYPKQLGVAFFMFVMGYGLAGETRPRLQVLFNRLFEIYLFGGIIALLMSVIMSATRGTLQLSNYEPFVLGVNVVFNNFPANPTTWYIGTYLHVLVLWAVALRKIRVRSWMLVVSLALEIPARAALVTFAGEYIGYMLFTNWVSVFLLGMLFGQRATSPAAPAQHQARRAGLYTTLLIAVPIAWYFAATPLVLQHTFPFMRLSAVGPLGDALTMSACASGVYLVATFLVFRVFSLVPRWTVARFLARNTLIVFIGHMPLFFLLDRLLPRWTSSYALQSVVQLAVCLGCLALVSELVTRALRPKALRDWTMKRLPTWATA